MCSVNHSVIALEIHHIHSLKYLSSYRNCCKKMIYFFKKNVRESAAIEKWKHERTAHRQLMMFKTLLEHVAYRTIFMLSKLKSPDFLPCTKRQQMRWQTSRHWAANMRNEPVGPIVVRVLPCLIINNQCRPPRPRTQPHSTRLACIPLAQLWIVLTLLLTCFTQRRRELM